MKAEMEQYLCRVFEDLRLRDSGLTSPKVHAFTFIKVSPISLRDSNNPTLTFTCAICLVPPDALFPRKPAILSYFQKPRTERQGFWDLIKHGREGGDY